MPQMGHICFSMYYIFSFILFVFGFLQATHNLPWSAAHSEIFVFFGLITFGLGSISKKKEIKIDIEIILLFVFLMSLIWIQFFIGKISFFGDAFLFNVYLFSCILSLSVAKIHGNNLSWIKLFAITLLLISLASSFISIKQALGTFTDSTWIFQPNSFRRPGANLAQPNHVGTLLIMGFASLIYLSQHLKISRTLKILCSLIIFFGIGITESRTALISSILLYGWWFAKNRIFIHPQSVFFRVTSISTLIAIIFTWPNLVSSFQEGGHLENPVLINTSSSMRLEMWAQIWQAALIKPWLGWGIRGTAEALNAVQHQYAQTQPFTYSHNIILEMIISIGFPLTLLTLYLISFNFYKWIRKTKTTEDWYAIALIIPFASHSCFEYPFAYAYLLIPFFLAIGILERENSGYFPIRMTKNICNSFIAIYAIIMFTISADYLIAEDNYRKSRFKASNIEMEFTDNTPIFLNQLEKLVYASMQKPKENMSQEEIEDLRKISFRFPWLKIQNNYAISLALNCKPYEAARQLKIMHAMHGAQRFEAVKQEWHELKKESDIATRTLEILNTVYSIN